MTTRLTLDHTCDGCGDVASSTSEVTLDLDYDNQRLSFTSDVCALPCPTNWYDANACSKECYVTMWARTAKPSARELMRMRDALGLPPRAP